MLEEIERLLDARESRGERPSSIVIGNRQAAALEAELRVLQKPVVPDPELIGMLAGHGVCVSWAIEMYEAKPPEINLVTMTGPATLYNVLILRVDEDDCLQVAVGAPD